MELTLQILLCVLAADFVTGLVHWWEDTYGDPSWPIIGEAVIEPNIKHHEDQALFARMTSLCSRNWQPLTLGIVACALAWAAGWFTWQLACVSALAAIGNEVHAWAHVRPANSIARMLQDMAIVQTPQQHAKHHRPPYASNFCSLTNLVNPVLEALRFWPALEWAVATTTGIEPKRMTEARRGK
jgi:sterol desaturase/sphingolipid hydroxylase (fatty acid hydroxylase superfamily)